METIPKETFAKYPMENKMDTVFDYVVSIHGILDCRRVKCNEREVACDIRITKIEKGMKKWKVVTASVGAVTGLFGGAGVMFAKLKWWG